MIKPMLDSMQVTPQGGHHPFQQAATTNPPVAAASGNTQSNQNIPGIQSPSVEREQPTANLPKDLPKFSSENAVEHYNRSKSAIHAKCDSDIQKLLDEFSEYLSTKEPSWSPSPRHIKCFGKFS